MKRIASILAIPWFGIGIFNAGLMNAAENHMFCHYTSPWATLPNARFYMCGRGRSGKIAEMVFVTVMGPLSLGAYFAFPEDHDGWSLAKGTPIEAPAQEPGR